MSVEGWKLSEKIMRDAGISDEIIENEKIKYVYDFGILQFDPEDKRPTEVTKSEPDENGMCRLGFRFYGVKSAIPYTRKVVIDDELLKFVSLPQEDQVRLRKLTYSPHIKDLQKYLTKYK